MTSDQSNLIGTLTTNATGAAMDAASSRAKLNSAEVAHDLEKSLLAGAAKQKSEELEKEKENNLKQKEAIKDLESSKYAVKSAAKYNETVQNYKILELEENNKKIEKSLKSSVERVEQYEKFLAKPLKELFQEHEQLELAYQKQQDLLLSWMASQTAYRFLAVKYGKESKVDREDIFLESKKLKPSYMEHIKKHGTKGII